MSKPIRDREEAIQVIENVMLGHRLSWELSRLIVDALGIGQIDPDMPTYEGLLAITESRHALLLEEAKRADRAEAERDAYIRRLDEVNVQRQKNEVRD